MQYVMFSQPPTLIPGYVGSARLSTDTEKCSAQPSTGSSQHRILCWRWEELRWAALCAGCAVRWAALANLALGCAGAGAALALSCAGAGLRWEAPALELRWRCAALALACAGAGLRWQNPALGCTGLAVLAWVFAGKPTVS